MLSWWFGLEPLWFDYSGYLVILVFLRFFFVEVITLDLLLVVCFRVVCCLCCYLLRFDCVGRFKLLMDGVLFSGWVVACLVLL